MVPTKPFTGHHQNFLFSNRTAISGRSNRISTTLTTPLLYWRHLIPGSTRPTPLDPPPPPTLPPSKPGWTTTPVLNRRWWWCPSLPTPRVPAPLSAPVADTGPVCIARRSTTIPVPPLPRLGSSISPLTRTNSRKICSNNNIMSDNSCCSMIKVSKS